VARVEAPRRRAHLFGVGRSGRSRVAHRLVVERDRAFRPGHRGVHELPVRPRRRERSPDARARGRSMGSRVGNRSPRANRDALKKRPARGGARVPDRTPERATALRQ
jgi:hypothetical protein